MISMQSRDPFEAESAAVFWGSSLMEVDRRYASTRIEGDNEIGNDRKQPFTTRNLHDIMGTIPEDAAHRPQKVSFCVLHNTTQKILDVELAFPQRRKRRSGQTQLTSSQA